MRAAVIETPAADPALFTRMDRISEQFADLRVRLFGDPTRGRLDEPSVPSIRSRVSRVIGGHWNTRQMPTATHQRNLEVARDDFASLRRELTAVIDVDLADLETALEAAGAPWTPGRRIPEPMDR